MGYDIETAAFCGDYFAAFDVPGSKGKVYRVTWNGATYGPHCTCPAFKYAPEDNKECKHITLTFREGCFYNPQWYDGGNQTIRPIENFGNIIPQDECPACGGPTVAVRIAV